MFFYFVRRERKECRIMEKKKGDIFSDVSASS